MWCPLPFANVFLRKVSQFRVASRKGLHPEDIICISGVNQIRFHAIQCPGTKQFRCKVLQEMHGNPDASSRLGPGR